MRFLFSVIFYFGALFLIQLLTMCACIHTYVWKVSYFSFIFLINHFYFSKRNVCFAYLALLLIVLIPHPENNFLQQFIDWNFTNANFKINSFSLLLLTYSLFIVVKCFTHFGATRIHSSASAIWKIPEKWNTLSVLHKIWLCAHFSCQ